MESIYLSTKQAAELLGFPKLTTKRILTNHGLVPIDLKAESGRGLRWLASAVRELAVTLHAEAQAKVEELSAQRAPVVEHPIIGKSVAQLYRELNPGMAQ